MNNYRLLGLSSLVTAVLLSILTFRFGLFEGERNLVFTFEVGVKFSLMEFRVFIISYFLTLSVIAFLIDRRAALSIGFFWLYFLLLIFPLTIFTIFIMIPEWTILLFSSVGVPGGYCDDIYNYGLFNISLIILNVSGLFIFSLQTIGQLKRT